MAEMGPEKFRNVFEIRIALEPLALKSAVPAIPAQDVEDLLENHRAAARRYEVKDETEPLLEIDTQVHDLILRHCSNEILTRIMADLRDLILWAQRTVVRQRPQALYESLCEHITLAEALVARDVGRAREALERHLVGVFERALAAFPDTGPDDCAFHKDTTPEAQEAQQ